MQSLEDGMKKRNLKKSLPKFLWTFSVDHEVLTHQKMFEDDIRMYGSVGTTCPVFMREWVRLWNVETLLFLQVDYIAPLNKNRRADKRWQS